MVVVLTFAQVGTMVNEGERIEGRVMMWQKNDGAG